MAARVLREDLVPVQIRTARKKGPVVQRQNAAFALRGCGFNSHQVQMNKKEIGKLGEKIAFNFLKKRGYKILGKNYFLKYGSDPLQGEIDLIAQKNDIIHFIEVKSLTQKQKNKSSSFPPEERVNSQKLKKIKKAGEAWLIKNKIPLDRPWQIDVLAITVFPQLKKAKIRRFENVS